MNKPLQRDNANDTKTEDKSESISSINNLNIPFKKPEKLSIKKCRAILKKEADNYTDEELDKIQDWFLQLVEIDYKNFIKIRAQKEQQNEKSNNLY